MPASGLANNSIGMTMRWFKRVLSALTFLQVTSAIPVTLTVPQGQVECFYEKLDGGEYATLSILITDGPSLKGTLILEGPFARSKVENTKELTEQEHEFAVNSNRWTKHTMYKEKIDFETVKEPSLQALQEEVEAIEDDDGIPDDLPKEEMKKLIEQRRRKRVEARRIARRARETKERDLARLQEEKQGVPYQKTILANADGWYRGCIFASFNLITVDLELRSSKDFDGIDPATNHVYSYEKHMERKEEKLLDEDTAESEPSLKVEDFHTTKNQMRELRRILNSISTMQNTGRNRMKQHSKISEHNNSRMTRDSLVLTIIFILVTAFQVYTIHSWFSGSASLLGR